MNANAAKLAQLFAGLGFRKVGEHKSKAVTRWSQGGINLVLNSDNEGFAHSHLIKHGPSVCAICLKVDDAAATLDRAEALHDAPFRQAVGPGELEIPAVRGLGGSLLYFVDPKSDLHRLWDIDFIVPDQAPENGGVGLTAIDHVSQSMHYEEMLSWLLFYNSLLDVTKTPQLDVIDPGGIVHSQVVQTDDGALRIVLNASQSQQTLSSRFLTHFFGSGVQHVAFASDDIVKTIARLRANTSKCCRSPTTIMTTWRRARIFRRIRSISCAPMISFMIATKPASICRPIRAASTGCSSLKSSSGAPIRDLAR